MRLGTYSEKQDSWQRRGQTSHVRQEFLVLFLLTWPTTSSHTLHFRSSSVRVHIGVRWAHVLRGGFIVDAPHYPPSAPLSSAPSPLDLSL